VDDPRSLLVAAADPVREQRVDERAARVPRRRVHDDAGGLVDDEQMLVLVGDADVDRLGLQLRRGFGGGLELELLPTFEPVALRARAPVEADRAGGDEPLRFPACPDLGQRGEKAVEPLPRGRVGNSEPDGQTRRGLPNMTAAKRIATPTQMNVSARLKAGQ
jgi:hypothetical protein